jgi:hypothetical protein
VYLDTVFNSLSRSRQGGNTLSHLMGAMVFELGRFNLIYSRRSSWSAAAVVSFSSSSSSSDRVKLWGIEDEDDDEHEPDSPLFGHSQPICGYRII